VYNNQSVKKATSAGGIVKKSTLRSMVVFGSQDDMAGISFLEILGGTRLICKEGVLAEQSAGKTNNCVC
jgi:hypothetical protein